MRKIAIVVLALAVTAGAVLGVVKTGFLGKAVWVFQTSSITAPGGRGGGSLGRADGAGGPQVALRDGAHFGKPGEGKGGRDGAAGSGVNLGNVGWFALIMAFFAMAAAATRRIRRPILHRAGPPGKLRP